MRSILIHGAAVTAGWLIAIGIAGPVAVQAGTIRSDRSDTLYRNLAAQEEFDPVGRFTWSEPGGNFLASGTLIRDDWVLTAAHVVDGTNGFGAGISNLSFDVGGETYSGVEWIPHENWAPSGGENNLFAGWDIGLVRLDRSVDNVDPAELFTGRNELGQQATIVGFGATGTGLTGATQPGGTKRAGQNIIDAVGPTATPGSVIAPPTDRLVTIDFDNPFNPGDSTLGSSTPLDLEYLTAPGDSGGGLFIDTPDGVQLAAVTSLGSTLDLNGANSDYGDRASFTRVSSFLDWIEGIIGPESLEGDFNLDGVVSAADFVVARDNDEGTLGLDQFSEQFGQVGGAAAIVGSPVSVGAFSVPEPSAAGILGLAMSLLVGFRRRTLC